MRLGLALSGGGLRATLYHLGVVRLLRDSDLLSQVTHVTAVSGGSVLAAHLALHWDRYCGSEEDFDDAAQDVLNFVSLDIRNRIVRRYPGMMAYGLWRKLTFRRNPRLFTRTGLLEWYYRKHLLGDACLHELPSSPEVHILSTDVSEGGFSSFTRERLLIQQRTGDGHIDVKPHRAGLARCATAVAASSAFPAFFPPLELRAEDVGSSQGEFPTQYFSDGGIYDNLGLRVFHYLSSQRRQHLRREDFLDEHAALSAWNKCLGQSERTGLRRLAELAGSIGQGAQHHEGSAEYTSADMLSTLNRLLQHHVALDDPELLSLLDQSRSDNETTSEKPRADGESDPDSRDLIADAFRRASGRECLRRQERLCDAVLASDAGKQFAVYGRDRTPGFLSTALRASDILMDRVWQLERDNFAHSPRYIFAAMSDTVPLEADPTAMHPEVQVQVSRIRTDMDRFNQPEISGLIRHGYCVARHALLSSDSSLADRIADGPPWDPTASLQSRGEREEDNDRTENVTASARVLQRSSRRKLWSAFFDIRDWTSWVYVPLLAFLLIVLPLRGLHMYHDARQDAALTRAVAEMREDFRTMLTLLELGTPIELAPMEFVETDILAPRLAEEGLDIISDNRITDLREWSGRSDDRPRHIHVSRHVLVRKVARSNSVPGLRLQSIWDDPDLAVECKNSHLKPSLRRRTSPESSGTRSEFQWEVLLDFSHVPVGETVELEINILLEVPAGDRSFDGRQWWQFEVDAEPEIATSWILLPEDNPTSSFDVIRSKNDDPSIIELVKPTHQTSMNDGSVINWSVVHPAPDYTYSTRWAAE